MILCKLVQIIQRMKLVFSLFSLFFSLTMNAQQLISYVNPMVGTIKI